ncbi:MAG TPA: nucleoside hydrolase [Acetobacteraceae bacterium]|nr:nucleoside hydrolase [Acetobacteraceae bacterium]
MNPRPTFIDCDPGTDDAIALWLALASPELDVQLVTAVGGNVGLSHTLRNARAIVGLAGRRDIPVVGGADRPLMGRFEDAAHVHGDNGLGGLDLPDGPPAAPGLAADVIRDRLRAAPPRSVTLIGLGPATNLGLVFATEPALAANVAEIVLMTGAVGEGNVTPSAEFNAWNDPEALAIVLEADAPVTLATLDVTNQALCRPAHVAALRAAAMGACAAAAAAIWDAVKPSRRSGGLGHEQHDACAVAWAVAPDMFSHVPVAAAVDCGPGPGRGRTVIDRWGRSGRPARARLLETVAAERFFALLTERLATLP